jgi:hypothetical protein
MSSAKKPRRDRKLLTQHLSAVFRRVASDPQPSNSRSLSDQDGKLFARLLRKYGWDTLAANKNMPLRSPGRPKRGHLPLHEAMHFAQCFEGVIAERREAGSKKPVRDAEIEMYNVIFSDEERRQPGHFERWRRTVKNKRLWGQRELDRWRRHLQTWRW